VPVRISQTLNKIIANESFSRHERSIIKVPWGIPEPGWVKINVDASICKNKCFNCIGFVIRDANNVFDAARVSSYRFASAEEGEATAVLNAIRWAQERGHQLSLSKQMSRPSIPFSGREV
ncbi:hypothetical protein GIB67_006096, partial [Kingdonia uniflora]